MAETDLNFNQKPYVDGAKTFYGGVVRDYSGKVEDVTSPILTVEKGQRVVIGKLAQMNTADVAEVDILCYLVCRLSCYNYINFF